MNILKHRSSTTTILILDHVRPPESRLTRLWLVTRISTVLRYHVRQDGPHRMGQGTTYMTSLLGMSKDGPGSSESFL